MCHGKWRLETEKKAKNAEACMDRKPEKIKSSIFREFLTIFRYFCGIPPKFHRNFFSDLYHYTFRNNTHWYFYETVIFRWLIKLLTLNLKSDIMIKTLCDSTIVSSPDDKKFAVSLINNFHEYPFQRYCLKSKQTFKSFIQNYQSW